MSIDKQKAFIVRVAFIVVILLLGYIGIKYVLPLLMPFVIGMVIAVIFRRPIDLLQKKTKIKRTYISLIMLILFYGLLGLSISMIGFKVFAFLEDLFSNAPTVYNDTILPALQKTSGNLSDQYPEIRTYVDNFMNNIDTSIFTFLSKASSTVLGMITSFAGQVPALLIKMIFTIVSSFFFTIDYYKITRFVILQFTGERRTMILNLKDNGIGTLGKFFRAYSIIISITFLELSIGFWIIGLPTPFLFGGLIAIIDVLPILGTGAVLLPWSIISFITDNTRVGLGMLLLYIVITVVRQTIEPKIVGQQIGLHPIVTLLLMFVGAQLMGVLGLFLLPIIATLLLKLNKDGTIKLLKKVD
jgi:sporulation integral membrane protein YtvI